MFETYRGTVYSWQCDHMGHMNIQYYAAKFDEATWQLFHKIHITPEYLRNNNRGMVAVDQRTKYKKELLPGDTIYIFSKVIEVKNKTIRFKHVMKSCSTDEIAAETELLGVHIDTLKRKSCEIQGDIYKTASGMCDADRRSPDTGKSLPSHMA